MRRSGAAGPRAWVASRPLAVVLIAALLFRAVYLVLYARGSIFFDGLILDSQVYDAWARAIAGGQWLGSEAFYFPPLYPYLLAVAFRLFGHSFILIYLGQAFLGLINIALIHAIGSRTCGPRVGLLAAAGAALYAPLPFFETKLLTTTLGLTLDLVALWLLVRAEDRSRAGGGGTAWLLAGLLIGLAAVCLPATVILALLYAGALTLKALVARGGGAEKGSARGAPAAALLLAGTFLGLSPVLAHNLYVAGDPLLLSGQGGITFYQGNHKGALGLYSVVPGFSGAPERQAEEEKAIAERETGKTLRRSQVSAYFLGRGLAFITGSPGAWLALEARKAGALLGDYEASTEYSLYLEREQVPWLYLACLPFAAIAGAGLAGLIFDRRTTRRGGAALGIYTLHAAAVPLLFYVSSRYRMPLVPALLIYGALFVDRTLDAMRQGAALPVARARALAAALGVALVSFFPLGAPMVTAEANVHYNIGNLLAERGRHEEAIAEFDRSLAEWPENSYALINRGNSLDRLGREDEALASYRRAEEADPRFFKTYQAQGVILHRRGRLAEEEAVYRRGLAAGGAEARYLLGLVLGQQGRSEEALRAFEEAVRINPRHAHAQARLGALYAARGDAARAQAHFRAALEADPSEATARAGLARLGG
ncbi:MAG TPA: tetratricopeptide repeat protein [Candidatus Polarisedimenticolia bacterium]|nr:tetratricopeptide repeat protein [Candidatus Polarisedimenticolia bacterium]